MALRNCEALQTFFLSERSLIDYKRLRFILNSVSWEELQNFMCLNKFMPLLTDIHLEPVSNLQTFHFFDWEIVDWLQIFPFDLKSFFVCLFVFSTFISFSGNRYTF